MKWVCSYFLDRRGLPYGLFAPNVSTTLGCRLVTVQRFDHVGNLKNSILSFGFSGVSLLGRPGQ
jgi:hypothetical protein